MLNQVVLVGRLTRDIKVLKYEEVRKGANIIVAVPRSFKNSNGEYDTDFVKCHLYDSVAVNTAEYCKKGDIVGIKGRISAENNKAMIVIAEKVTFLSSRGANSDDNS